MLLVIFNAVGAFLNATENIFRFNIQNTRAQLLLRDGGCMVRGKFKDRGFGAIAS
jgi:hypothetical protein